MAEEGKQQSWWQTLPGVFTAIGAFLSAVTGLIVVLRHDDQPKTTPVTAPAAPAVTQQAQAPPQKTERQATKPEVREIQPLAPNVAGIWRDNWGAVSQIVQNGSAFQFTARGTSCRGQFYQSTGAGRITGHTVQSNYQSSLPSQGTCSGTLSPDGAQITSTCTDSLCGTFVSSSVRQ